MTRIEILALACWLHDRGDTDAAEEVAMLGLLAYGWRAVSAALPHLWKHSGDLARQIVAEDPSPGTYAGLAGAVGIARLRHGGRSIAVGRYPEGHPRPPVTTAAPSTFRRSDIDTYSDSHPASLGAAALAAFHRFPNLRILRTMERLNEVAVHAIGESDQAVADMLQNEWAGRPAAVRFRPHVLDSAPFPNRVTDAMARESIREIDPSDWRTRVHALVQSVIPVGAGHRVRLADRGGKLYATVSWFGPTDRRDADRALAVGFPGCRITSGGSGGGNQSWTWRLNP